MHFVINYELAYWVLMLMLAFGVNGHSFHPPKKQHSPAKLPHTDSSSLL